MRSLRSPHRLVILVLTLATAVIAAPTTKDAAADALRQAADKAVREGKFDDAITLLTKITQGEAARYQDFMLLGKACEKVNKDRDAAAAYRRVLELLPESPEKREERSARNEAKQKLASLDVLGGKIDALVKDTEKRILDLLKDAEKGGEWESVGRLLKMYALLRTSQGDTTVQYLEVMANKSYQQAGFKVATGKSYRIRAAGRWRVSPAAECGPDGVKGPLAPNAVGPVGSLLMLVSQDKDNFKVVKVGPELTWKAVLSGTVLFVINEEKLWETAGKEDNSGSLHVLIEQMD